MQVRDEVAWAEQLSEFEIDEVSKKFGAFLKEWTQNIEVQLPHEPQGHDGSLICGYAAPVSKALEVTEQTMGFLSVEWIAQMLLVITQHWVHGEQLYEGLTFIEKRLVEQATAVKLAELQSAASIATEG